MARSTIIKRPASTYQLLLDMMGCKGAPCETLRVAGGTVPPSRGPKKCAEFSDKWGLRHDKDGIYEELWTFIFPTARKDPGVMDTHRAGKYGAVRREDDPEPVLKAFLEGEDGSSKGEWCKKARRQHRAAHI